jgi:hypothetical protein
MVVVDAVVIVLFQVLGSFANIPFDTGRDELENQQAIDVRQAINMNCIMKLIAFTHIRALYACYCSVFIGVVLYRLLLESFNLFSL